MDRQGNAGVVPHFGARVVDVQSHPAMGVRCRGQRIRCRGLGLRTRLRRSRFPGKSRKLRACNGRALQRQSECRIRRHRAHGDVGRRPFGRHDAQAWTLLEHRNAEKDDRSLLPPFHENTACHLRRLCRAVPARQTISDHGLRLFEGRHDARRQYPRLESAGTVVPRRDGTTFLARDAGRARTRTLRPVEKARQLGFRTARRIGRSLPRLLHVDPLVAARRVGRMPGGDRPDQPPHRLPAPDGQCFLAAKSGARRSVHNRIGLE